MPGSVHIDESVPWALTWTVTDEPLQRSWHALADGGKVWLVDPVDDPEVRRRAEELGEVAGVIQLLDRHERSGPELAERYGVELHRLPEGPIAGSPLESFSLVSVPGWREVGLWWPEYSALVVPEAVGTVDYFSLGRRLGMHPFLRALPPGDALRAHAPEHLLVGHGPPLHEEAATALDEAVDRSRIDIPRSLPQMVKSFTDRG
jgi:hypothetical protein